MTSISHAIIGAAIAAKIGNPYLAAPVALGLHLACDAIPHWDLGTNWRNRPEWMTGGLAIGETLIALFIGLVVFYPFVASKAALFAAVIFSLLPDWLEAPHFIFKEKSPQIFHTMYEIQSKLHARMQLPWGLITQVITVVVALFVGFGI